MTATYLLFSLTYKNKKNINLLSFVLIVLFGWVVFSLGLRAQIFTFFLLILLNFLLTLKSKNAKYLIPLVFLLWVNVHGAFVVGFILLFTQIVKILVNKSNKKSLNIMLFITIFSFLITLINPYGFQIYDEILRHVAVPLKNLIAEWVAPNLAFKLVVTFITTLSLLGVFLKGKKYIYLAIPLAAFTYLGLSAKRNLPILGLIYVFTLYDLYSTEIQRAAKSKLFSKSQTIISLALIFYASSIRIPQTLSYDTTQPAFCKNGILPYPCSAVEFIKQNKTPGTNVFTSYEWGGFLEWMLPSYRFFVDGRTPAWPTSEGLSPYTVYLKIIQAQPGYMDILTKYQTDWLLLPANTYLDIELSTNSDDIYKEIYRDDISVIYVKNTN